MTQQEDGLGRKVVTLYGERGIVTSLLEDPYTMERGYAQMNENIALFAKKVTVHSVTYAPLMFPEPSGYRVWLYATIVYSGDVDTVAFFSAERNTSGMNRGESQTALRVYL